MDYKEAAAAFLRRHDMHPDQTVFPELIANFREEMQRGLRGEASSLGMFPAYIRADGELKRDARVLVLDAGGTNLRAGRFYMTPEGELVAEEIRKSRMPGTLEPLQAEEMFEAIAREAAAVDRGNDQACISFSYPCEVLPNADGRMIRLTKELHVEGLEGSLICEPLEAAMQAQGAPGTRRWRLINDTVGTMLGGAAQCPEQYDAYIGFILGTGTNVCCAIAAEKIRKSPAAAAMGGEVIVNLESGGFNRLLRGEGDRRLDAASEKPGGQWEEKMIAGAYFPRLLQLTLMLAAEEGLLPEEVGERLAGAAVSSRDVDLLCLEAAEGDLFAALCGQHRPFAQEVNALLLRRAAKITAGVLRSIIEECGYGERARICVCADGTTFARNPLIRPLAEEYLRELAAGRGGPVPVFFQTNDATLLGSAYAALLP